MSSPEIDFNGRYTHQTAGGVYRPMFRTNESPRKGYPLTVVYINEDDATYWSVPVATWNKLFTKLPDIKR